MAALSVPFSQLLQVSCSRGGRASAEAGTASSTNEWKVMSDHVIREQHFPCLPDYRRAGISIDEDNVMSLFNLASLQNHFLLVQAGGLMIAISL